MRVREWTAARKRAFGAALLGWYEAEGRELPWRRDCDPYRVWVSEIMLQQTRVAVVIPYFERFLRKFPTVRRLAEAREASVLAAWSGLGYYRRARMMHAAARAIVRDRAGEFPETLEGWRALPGIGRYTGAAITSIAFGAPHAVVDGNVERVLARLSGSELKNSEAWDAAQQLLAADRPGDHNQAMMELGATVCTPAQPRCSACPVIRFCAGRGAETRRAPEERNRETVAYALALRANQVFLVQRPADAARMASMWELPELGSTNGDAPVMSLKHSITNTDYDVAVYRAERTPRVAGRWVSLRQLSRMPLTGLARKVLRRAEALI